MNGSIQSLVLELRGGLAALYVARLHGVYLYGSYARGEQQRDSDIDVLIVLDELLDYGAEMDRTGELVSRISLDYRVSVSRVFVSAQNWSESHTRFLRNARREAIIA